MAALEDTGMRFAGEKGWHCFRVVMGCCETGQKGFSGVRSRLDALVGAGRLEKEQRGSRPSAGRNQDRIKTGVNVPKPTDMYRYFVEMRTFNWRAACE